MRPTPLLPGILGLTLPLAINAQTSLPRTAELEAVVVTAEEGTPATAKTELSPEEADDPASVTEVGREEIDSLPVVNYPDLFRKVAGVTVNDFRQGGVASGIAELPVSVSGFQLIRLKHAVAATSPDLADEDKLSATLVVSVGE
jgi:outer membrane receptor protein involved in Fe transport